MSQTGNKLLAFVPGIVAGLFLGRLLSELWARWTGSTELWLAVFLTILSVLLCARLFAGFPLSITWPALLLLGYVLFPEYGILPAVLIALLALLTWIQILDIKFSVPSAVNYLIPLVLLLLCFLLYLRTLAPDILPADNGEFQLVATNLGVAHPPGFPLYTMMAHLMTRLPLGPSPAYRVNLFSAVTSTLALAAVYASVFLLTRRHLASIAATLALATATTFWAQATTANIRSMTAFFAALIFFTLVLFYLAATRGDSSKKDRTIILFALVFGLGLSHHLSLAFLGLVAIIFILLVDTTLWRKPSRWWRPILAFFLGLLPLLYLPIRANAPVRGASPALATWSGFLEHVLATGFSGDLFVYLEAGLLVERLKIMLNVLTFQFSLGLVLILCASLILLIWQEWRLAFLFGGSALLFTLVAATYRAPQTVEYMLPAYVGLVLLFGSAGGGIVGKQMALQNGIWPAVRSLLTALVIVLAICQGLSRYDSYERLSGEEYSRDYAKGILEGAPPEILLLANWHWATPLWYLQEVEGVRPDVEVRYVFPEGEPYAQTWTRRVSEGLVDGRNVITTNFDTETFAALPTAEPIAEAFLFRQEARTQLPQDYSDLELLLGDTIEILGYQTDRDELLLGESLTVTLAWRAEGGLDDPATMLFVHLVTPDGRLAGQNDVPARAQDEGITLTQFHLTPLAGTQPGSLEIHVGAYREQPMPASDGETRTPISSVQLLPSDFAPLTQNPVHRVLQSDRSRRMIGYDRDNTLPEKPRLYLHWQTDDGYVTEIYDNSVPTLPAFVGPWGALSNNWAIESSSDSTKYVPLAEGIVWTGDTPLFPGVVPGQELTLHQTLRSTFPILSDQVVSVRLIGYEDDGFHWAWSDLDDAVPAMGAIPTLKWIGGSQVTSPHFVTVSESAQDGQDIGGALTLYDAFTGRVLPILDDRLAGEFGWIPLNKTYVPRYVSGDE